MEGAAEKTASNRGSLPSQICMDSCAICRFLCNMHGFLYEALLQVTTIKHAKKVCMLCATRGLTIAEPALAVLGDIIHIDGGVACQNGLELRGLQRKHLWRKSQICESTPCTTAPHLPSDFNFKCSGVAPNPRTQKICCHRCCVMYAQSTKKTASWQLGEARSGKCEKLFSVQGKHARDEARNGNCGGPNFAQCVR
eukprot:1159417-Pelagomonas_calceolata.AAC.7